MIKVLLTDDQKSFLDVMRFSLKPYPDLLVAGMAGNGFEALEQCKKIKPDVVLMDLSMPVCDGVEGTRLIKEYNRDIKVLIVTTFDDAENIALALSNGADGYVLKDIETPELVMAIRNAMAGFGTIDKSVLNKVVRFIDPGNKVEQVAAQKVEYGLTDKEIQIMRMIVDGMSNKEIADKMFFTEGTIKNTITAILAKLELKDRTQLAVFAIRHNLV